MSAADNKAVAVTDCHTDEPAFASFPTEEKSSNKNSYEDNGNDDVPQTLHSSELRVAGGSPSNAHDHNDDAEKPKSRREQDVEELQTLFNRYRVRIWLFLFLLGLVNNFHYNLVISGANGLAEAYGMKKLVALVSFANVFFGIVARVLNTFVFNRISYNIRMTLMSICTLFGLFFVALSGPFGHGNNASSFVVLLVGVALTGTAYSYGESVALTYVQRYPPQLVGAWGSGTGISGVITSVLYIVITGPAGLTQAQLFFITMPLAAVYWLTFTFGLVSPHKVVTFTSAAHPEPRKVVISRGHEERILATLRAEPGADVSDYHYEMVANFFGLSWRSVAVPQHVRERQQRFREQEQRRAVAKSRAVDDLDALPAAPTAGARKDVDDDDDIYYCGCRPLCGCLPRNFALRRWWRENGEIIGEINGAMLWFYFNLGVVYIAEYAAQFMAPFSFYCKSEWHENFFINYSYTITQFCYQLGVFLSRSSLPLVRIPFIGVISILQVINAVCWFVQAKVLYIAARNSETREMGLSFILFIWMIFVGLLGGASYVNVFFLILCKGREMQQVEEDAKAIAFLEETRPHHQSREGLDDGDADDDNMEGGERRPKCVTSADATTTTTTTMTTTVTSVVVPAPPQREETEGLSVSSPTCKGKDANGCGQQVEGQLLSSSSSSSSLSSSDGENGNTGAHPRHRHRRPRPHEKNAVDEHRYLAVIEEYDTHPNRRERCCRFIRFLFWQKPAEPSKAESLTARLQHLLDVEPLSGSEEEWLATMKEASGAEWQSRRELAMSLGSLYAMVSICIGTAIDVMLTNTALKGINSCPS